jgi:hypothetical protein
MTNIKMILQLAMAVSILIACGPKNANAGNEPDQMNLQEPLAPEKKDSRTYASIDGISQFVSWDMGAMSVSKQGDLFVIKNASEHLELFLKPTGNGTYQETSGKEDMIGQSARFVAEKVGEVTTLTAYRDKMMLFSLLSCDSLMAYRDRGYHRILTSQFEPTDDGVITITDDMMRGPILPDSPDVSYFFIEDGKGDLTDKIRLSPGRFHLYFSPADKGVNLHFCRINPETDDLEPDYERENSIILRYAKDPGWPWLSTDVLDVGFITENFDKPFWKLMLNKLKAKKQPNEVEQWNRRLIENIIKYNEPFSGLASTDY